MVFYFSYDNIIITIKIDLKVAVCNLICSDASCAALNIYWLVCSLTAILFSGID